MKRIIAALVLAGSVANPALATVVTRSYQVDASEFWHFFGNPAPFSTLTMQFQLTFDDAADSDILSPDSFSAITDGEVNVGPFSAAPGFKYIVNPGMGAGPAISLGGILNGHNVSMPGTNDFSIRFNPNNDVENYVMLSFSTVGSGSFTAANAVIRQLDLTASAVPEPSTWAMMFFAFGLVGVALRGRRPDATRLPA